MWVGGAFDSEHALLSFRFPARMVEGPVKMLAHCTRKWLLSSPSPGPSPQPGSSNTPSATGDLAPVVPQPQGPALETAGSHLLFILDH